MRVTWDQAKDWIQKGAAILALIHAGMEAWEAFNVEVEESNGKAPPL